MKKYSDGTIPTIVVRKVHKDRPIDCNEFRMIEYLKRMKGRLYDEFVN